MREIKQKRNFSYYLWHFFVIMITIASLLEVIISFIPISQEHETASKVFFMSLTIIGFFYEVMERLLSNFTQKNNLLDMIDSGLILSRTERIESSVLYEIETDLDSAFKSINGSYHIIVVTACLDSNEDPFINAIWNNIKDNRCKYLYITPDDDQTFINSLVNKFNDKAKSINTSDIYKQVVNSISHIRDEKLFNVLPDSFDLCIYCKDINGVISVKDAKGFCCCQNENINTKEGGHSFYYPMSKHNINRVYECYNKEFEKERILQPYISKKIERKNSSIHGTGLFCKYNKNIARGEIVLIKGGYELHRSEMSALQTIDSYLPIGDDLFLAGKSVEDEKHVKLFINHSCMPNVGMLNERTFVAMRNINSGEEITIDYAFVDNESYSFQCNCGSKNCRNTVTGYDWKIKELQRRYNSYFSPYLKEKF